MAFTLTTAEAALHAWLLSCTGLGEDDIIWADQEGYQPTGPYMTMRLASFSPVSPHEDVLYDEDESPPVTAGAEITRTAIAYRLLTLFLQAFSRDVHGASGAFEIARKAQMGLTRPSVQQALRAAGLAVADVGAPRNVTTLFDTDFVGRFALDVTFNVTDEDAQTLTFIETVEGEGEVSSPSETYAFPYSATIPAED